MKNNNKILTLPCCVGLLFIALSFTAGAEQPDNNSWGSWYEKLVAFLNIHLAPESPGQWSVKQNESEQYQLYTNGDLILSRKLNLSNQTEVDAFFGTKVSSEYDHEPWNNNDSAIVIVVQPGFRDEQLLSLSASTEIPEETLLVLDLKYLPSSSQGCYSSGLSIGGVESLALMDIVLEHSPAPMCLANTQNKLPIRQASGRGLGGKRGVATDGVQGRRTFTKTTGPQVTLTGMTKRGTGYEPPPPPRGGKGKKKFEPGSQSAFEKLQTLIRQLADQKRKREALNRAAINSARRLMKGLTPPQLAGIQAMREYILIQDVFVGHLPVFL